jgi:hypothetical protein
MPLLPISKLSFGVRSLIWGSFVNDKNFCSESLCSQLRVNLLMKLEEVNAYWLKVEAFL